MAKAQKPPQFQLERTFFKAGFLDHIPRYEMPEGAAQAGSYNFIIDGQGKWARRWGTKFLGTKSTDTGVNIGCRNASVLIRRDGVEIPIVQYGTKLKILHPDSIDWSVLLTGLDANAIMGFAPSDLFSDNTNVIVFSNGVDAYQYWNGATGTLLSATTSSITFNISNLLTSVGFETIGTLVSSNGTSYTYEGIQKEGAVASTTTNTIVVSGALTLAQLGFAASGTVTDLGSSAVFTYTGISTNTFTGVTPDPTVDPNLIVVGEVVSQSGNTQTFLGVSPDPSSLPVNEPIASAPIIPDPTKTYKGNVLAATQYGRIVMGNVVKTGTLSGNGSLFISVVDSYEDFSSSTPRVTGEGAIVNAPNGGGACRGIQPFEDGFVIAKDRVIYTLGIDDGSTIPFPLDILVPHEGSISPLSFFPSENTINYVTSDYTISSLQRVAQYDQFAHPLPISDPIKDTVDSLFFDITTAGKFYDGIDFYSMKTDTDVPVNNRILSRNNRYGVWDCPWQGLSAGCFFIYGANFYSCDAATPDVYLMGSESEKFYNDFMTNADPGFSIPGTLFLRNNPYGTSAVKKDFNEYWIEGEMFLSDAVTFTAIYDDGRSQISGTLAGTETGLMYTPTGGFGVNDIGADTFGEGDQGSQGSTDPIRFRLIITTETQAFYELALKIDCTGYFRLIAHGPKLNPSTEVPDDAIYQSLS